MKTKRIFADIETGKADQFLAKARLAGTTGQQLVESVVDAYLGGDRKHEPRFTKDEQKWIDKLLFILKSEDAGAIDAVKSNLDCFERLVKIATGPLDEQRKRA